MMMRLALALLAFLPDGLTAEEFEKLHKRLQPPKGEPWQTIPWKTSLQEARERAVADKKPIFMWSMDGTPLGCG